MYIHICVCIYTRICVYVYHTVKDRAPSTFDGEYKRLSPPSSRERGSASKGGWHSTMLSNPR